MKTTINFDLELLNTFSSERFLKIKDQIETVINSDLFKQKILSASFHGETSEYKNSPNNHIYEYIMMGAETLSPMVDYRWDIVIDEYYTKDGVVGYTLPNTPTQFINERLLANMSDMDLGSWVGHEYLHKIGFKHDFFSTPRRPNSVCYQFNRIYEDCFMMIYHNKVRSVSCRRTWKKLYLGSVCTTTWVAA